MGRKWILCVVYDEIFHCKLCRCMVLGIFFDQKERELIENKLQLKHVVRFLLLQSYLSRWNSIFHDFRGCLHLGNFTRFYSCRERVLNMLCGCC